MATAWLDAPTATAVTRRVPVMPPLIARQSRERLLELAADAGDDGADTLDTMMRAMSHELAADGMLVAWHSDEADPVLLFADGLCEPDDGDAQAQAASAAMAIAGNQRDEAQSRWRTLDDASDGGVFVTSIRAGAGIVTITSLFARLSDATRGRARDAAARLLPLVHPFFRLWSGRLRTLSRVRGLTAAVNKSDVGILLVNRDGRVVFANAAADALIERGDGLRRTGGMLRGARLADTLRLHAAIEHVVQGVDMPAVGGAPVVALHRQQGRPLLAAVIGSDAVQAGADDSAAVVYVFDPEQNLRPLIEPACKLYGLTPVETRLACLLTDGIALADAAERMRVREQTARSYLKQIFLKTDTNRQAELVWLMLKSSVRTAPGCRARFV